MKPKKSAKKKAAAIPPPRPAASSESRKPEPPAPAAPAKETKPAVPAAKSAPKAPAKAPLKVPPILLEGDKPVAPSPSGPGKRYALGPTPPVAAFEAEGELPEAYGTQQLLLTARDPHWLYAHWDLTREQQNRYNSLSRDKHLVLRIYLFSNPRQPVSEIHVHPESRHWFAPVERAGAKYIAELGYFNAKDKWTVVSASAATLTPPDSVSSETHAEFATIPIELPMAKLLSLVKEAIRENVPLAQALQELRAEGHSDLPAKFTATTSWTPAQERALAEIISMDRVRRVWMGSLEITELIRRQFVNELASMAAAQLGGAQPGAPTSPMGISSPFGGVPRGKGFWFNVNAELIVYGATEPSATVMIGGRPIQLRPDGSFSYRFALPDGQYEMPVVAVSADQTDGRAAELKFSRSTEYRGDVGAHPQDPALQQLILENF